MSTGKTVFAQIMCLIPRRKFDECVARYNGDYRIRNFSTKEMLDIMHKRKIDLAQSIYVINRDGYIGRSTRSEIEYAKAAGKEIYYME